MTSYVQYAAIVIDALDAFAYLPPQYGKFVVECQAVADLGIAAQQRE